MNSKLTIILIIFFQLLFLNKIFSKEIQFNANEIEVLDGGNETIAKNGTAFIEKDKISVTGAIIKYKKNKSLLIINEGEIKKIDDNLKINSKVIEYDIDQSNLYLKNNVKINDIENKIKISTDEINYDVEKQKIESSSNSEIKDSFGNIYQVSKFEYNIKSKIIKLSNLKVLDVSENILKLK